MPVFVMPSAAVFASIGQPLDGRSDLFSLGVILWEMLVGRRLFPHEPATVLSDRPQRPSEFKSREPSGPEADGEM